MPSPAQKVKVKRPYLTLHFLGEIRKGNGPTTVEPDGAWWRVSPQTSEASGGHAAFLRAASHPELADGESSSCASRAVGDASLESFHLGGKWYIY